MHTHAHTHMMQQIHGETFIFCWMQLWSIIWVMISNCCKMRKEKREKKTHASVRGLSFKIQFLIYICTQQRQWCRFIFIFEMYLSFFLHAITYSQWVTFILFAYKFPNSMSLLRNYYPPQTTVKINFRFNRAVICRTWNGTHVRQSMT